MLKLWYLPVAAVAMIVAAVSACTPRVAPQIDSSQEIAWPRGGDPGSDGRFDSGQDGRVAAGAAESEANDAAD